LLVTMVGGKEDPVARRLMMTAVVAAAAAQPGVVAVYWGEGTLLHYPPVFLIYSESFASPQAPPIQLWVDIRVFRNEDGTSGLFTTGLRALGHKEIEAPRMPMPPAELRDWMENIIYYLLENGPVLKDGQTIGVSAEDQIPIRHVHSEFGHKGTVIRFG
jgi:hypothetical protein